MVDFTITERTEPFTLEEVFDFIDDTSISKIDAHELKSRIVDVVHDTRNKAIDEFTKEIVTEYDNDGCPNVTDYLDYRLTIRELFEIAEQMRGEQA